MANLTQQNITIAKLYTALFNRAPDAVGFAFWVQAYENGASLTTLARSFLTTSESLAIYPAAQTDTQFVTAFYTSVFGRAPDAEGLAFWSAALAANGGSASPAARALLTQQITDIVATPLTTRPPGMSDAALAQTIADRAMFANKIEFSVYFATELKSNDIALAKSTMLLVTSTPGSLAAARESAATGGFGPTPNISSADSVDAIASKLAAYSGADGFVNAAGMSAAQLVAVSAGVNKIAASGITNLTVPLGDALVLDTVLSALLTKSDAVKIDATGAATAKLVLLASSLVKVVDDGIIGTLGLSNDLTNAQLTTLLGAKTGLAANVQVDASLMDVSKLALLIAAGAKVDGITGALAFTAAIGETDITALAAKYTGNTALVNAATMTTAQLAAVAAASGKIAAGGISALALALNLVDDAATAGLLSKATGATVVATGGSDVEVSSLASNLGNIVAGGITGTLAMTVAISNTNITALFGKYTGTAAIVDATSMTAPQLAAVAAATGKIATDGITGMVVLDPTLTDVQLTALLGTRTSSAADVQVISTGMDAPRLTALAAGVAKIDSINGVLAITSAIGSTGITDLFAKYTAGTATATATNMDAAQLIALAAVVGQISVDRIVGTLSLSNSLSDMQLTALLGAQTSLGADVNVLATGMDAAKVATLVAGLAKVDTITGALAITSAVTDVTALLAKYTGTTATVNVTGMVTAQLDALLVATSKIAATGITGTLALNQSEDLVTNELLSKSAAGALSVVATGASATEVSSLTTNLTKIAANGISGDLAITSAVTDVAALLAKYSGTTATVNVTGMVTAQLDALLAATSKIAATGITGTLALNQSEDLVTSALLSKSAAGTLSVVATGASATEVTALVTSIAKIAPGGISGDLAITSALSGDDITNLLAKYTGTGVTVNAAGMFQPQLDAVAAATSKIAANGIAAPNFALTGAEDSVTSVLLSKGTDATIDASGGTSAEYAMLATNIGHIAAGGISGGLQIVDTTAATDTALTALLAKYAGTTAVVDATGMSQAKLAAVADAATKVQSISGMTLALNDLAITDSVTSTLLAKSSLAGAIVTATDGTAGEIASLVSHIAKLSNEGLRGTFSLTDVQLGTITTTTLNAKLDAAANLTVTGATAGADSINVTGITKAVKVEGGAGADVITVKANDTVIIASTADSRSGFSATDTTMANIEQITGFVNTGRIQLSTGNAAYGAFAFTGATVVRPFLETSVVLTADQTFADLYAAFDLQGLGPTASSATELFAYVVTVTGSSALSGRYLIINDALAALNSNDFIVSVGTTAMLDSGTLVIV
jgi:ribosomal silencing factor RsfS